MQCNFGRFAASMTVCAVAALLFAAVARSSAVAEPETSVAGATDGWYSTAQAAQGAKLFAAKCSVCHGAKLQGGAGPQLVGNQFFLRFGGKPVSQLWTDVHTEMPLNAPASMSNADSLAVIAFILQQNGFPAGASAIIGHYDTLRLIPKSAPSAGGATAAAPRAAATPMVVRQPSTNIPTQQELEGGDADSDNWLAYGKGYSGARYSTLADITTKNVAQLKPLCSVELAPGGSFEGSPVAYDGILYVTTTNGTFAIDGRTCAKIWSSQYEPVEIAAGANNKGAAIGGGRVIRGTIDGHLIALDIKTGAVLWDRKIMDSSTGASAMAAPLIWKDLVYMPTAGGDVGVAGRFMAFHVSDGTPAWTFDAIPTGDATGASSWQKPGTAAAACGRTTRWIRRRGRSSHRSVIRGRISMRRCVRAPTSSRPVSSRSMRARASCSGRIRPNPTTITTGMRPEPRSLMRADGNSSPPPVKTVYSICSTARAANCSRRPRRRRSQTPKRQLRRRARTTARVSPAARNGTAPHSARQPVCCT